ncbi:MAG: general secretion pathway protein GspK [Phycisphaerales bacterium]|nr:MAG: general secretion pathway protein GspK [Phycisphaerales bacterium]
MLITLVILVVLSILGYTLSVQVAAHRHRNRYLIDYAQAQYACASGIKQAITALSDLQWELISRPNEPDFSDVFAMSEPVYQDFLAQAAPMMTSDDTLTDAKSRRGGLVREDVDDSATAWDDDANDIPWQEPVAITGPYGPPWPLVTDAVEFEVGSAKVKVEIEDENAKYPLGWALIQDEELQTQAEVGFVTFCEWMGYQANEIDALREGLVAINKIRPFQIKFEATTAPATTSRAAANLRNRVSRSRSRTTATRQTRARRAVPVAEQIQQQNAIFSRLFHSSIVDTDLLARPSIASESREESALKYLGRWATRAVNINTAPRHVLEAALTFGSIADAPKIAEIVIQQRQEKPFSDIEELKQAAFRYTDAIEKCRDFITTTSTVVSVKVTAVSGVARSVAVAGVSKDGQKIKRIGVISD